MPARQIEPEKSGRCGARKTSGNNLGRTGYQSISRQSKIRTTRRTNPPRSSQRTKSRRPLLAATRRRPGNLEKIYADNDEAGYSSNAIQLGDPRFKPLLIRLNHARVHASAALTIERHFRTTRPRLLRQDYPRQITCDSHPRKLSTTVTPRQSPTTVTHDSHPRQSPTTVTHDSHPRQSPTTVTHDSHPRLILGLMLLNCNGCKRTIFVEHF